MKPQFSMTNDIKRALAFARIAHGDQVRHGTGEPYWHHPVEVANIVAASSNAAYFVDEIDIIAALLHDVVEDTYATHEDIVLFFGAQVADMVAWLTDVAKPEDGIRSKRKAMNRAHSFQAPPRVQTIKYGDVIANMRSIGDLDEAFSRLYVVEKSQLLQGLDKGNPLLYTKAIDAVSDATDTLWEKA